MSETLVRSPEPKRPDPAVDVVVPSDEQTAPIARIGTILIIVIPFVALVGAVIHMWGHGIHLRDVVLAVILYFVAGHGISIGYHRMLTHRSFVARRPVKLVLVALGSMAFQGGPIGWVAAHRRHHVFADRPGDPHSPLPLSAGLASWLHGLWHAHMGWFFTDRGERSERRAADLHADRDLVVMNALFPVFCVISLAIPFALGWLLGGTIGAALTALVWAGLVRVFVLHHVTWSVNSLAHTFGRRPFVTKDRSTNIAVMSFISMGESWHNGHHAFPRSARHGLLRGQWDTSARLIAVLERIGWVQRVQLPTADALAARLVGAPVAREASR